MVRVAVLVPLEQQPKNTTIKNERTHTKNGRQTVFLVASSLMDQESKTLEQGLLE